MRMTNIVSPKLGAQASSITAAVALVAGGIAFIPFAGQASITYPLDLSNYTYEPKGDAWVDAPFEQRVYLMNRELLSQTSTVGLGDDVITYLPSGATCTYSTGTSFSGPAMFWKDSDKQSRVCEDASSSTVERQAIPFGFDINFGGATLSGGYLIPAGAIVFDSENYTYASSASSAVFSLKTSGITAFGADLMAYTVEGKPEESSYIWTAQTTIGGKQAFVASWENMYAWSNRNPGAASFDDQPVFSFQIVILNDGDGNFTTWFNYDRIDEDIIGYSAPQMFSNFETGKISDSEYRVYTDAGYTPDTCQPTKDSSRTVSMRFYGPTGQRSRIDGLEDSNQLNGENIVGLGSLKVSGENSVQFFSDTACTNPIEAGVLDGIRYAEIRPESTVFRAVHAGWYVWDDSDPLDVQVEITEFFPNVDRTTLHDASDPATRLIANSLNSEVLGRYIVGMVGGRTVGDPKLDTLQGTETVIAEDNPRIPGQVAPTLGTSRLTVFELGERISFDSNPSNHDVFSGLLNRTLERNPESQLASLVAGSGAMTVFIPTDKAFRNLLSSGSGRANLREREIFTALAKLPPKQLESILLNHVFLGKTYGFGESLVAKRTSGTSASGLGLQIVRGKYGYLGLKLPEAGNKGFRPKVLPFQADINYGNRQVAHMVHRVFLTKPQIDKIRSMNARIPLVR
jgi:hypothetical protein